MFLCSIDGQMKKSLCDNCDNSLRCGAAGYRQEEPERLLPRMDWQNEVQKVRCHACHDWHDVGQECPKGARNTYAPLSPRFEERLNWMETESKCARACPDLDQELPDPVNHPPHYTTHPSGVECIAITEHMNFCVGNAIKYLWRSGQKGSAIEDLKKARWYIDREIARIEGLT